MKMDLLIHNVRVWDDQPLMDIGIKDGKIAAMEEGIEASAVEASPPAAVQSFQV